MSAKNPNPVPLDLDAHSPRQMIGLVGTGLMGSAIAQRLFQASFMVMGHDLNPARAETVHRLGGQVADGLPELAARCDRILLSLPDSTIVQSVLEHIGEYLRPGQVILDTTTGNPKAAIETGRRLEGVRVAYLDAAICGNSDQLRIGDVIIVAGGLAEAYARCLDLFAALARRSFHVGAWGAGSRMKLTTNLVLGLNRLVLAEGLSFAQALGLDPALALDVLRESSSYSRVMDIKGDKMLGHDFTPQARLSQHSKDVRLMLGAGAETRAKLPMTELHRQLLEAAEAAGLGELDNSAIIKLFRDR